MKATDQALYHADFYRWSRETAEALRERRFEDIDADHVAEEIEDMGKSEKRELHSLLDRLIEHLLKLGYACRSPSVLDSMSGWEDEIDEFRTQIERRLEDSPSLRPTIMDQIPRSYHRARRRLLRHGLADEGSVPESCPFAGEQILDENFFPR
jgi:Domain of unknown function DUF29